jgi:hypothetical protein
MEPDLGLACSTTTKTAAGIPTTPTASSFAMVEMNCPLVRLMENGKIGAALFFYGHLN